MSLCGTLPSKLRSKVAAGPCLQSWPLGSEVVLHFSRRASDSARLYHPWVSISQACRLNTAGWETAGHRGGIPFGMGCKPAELTKPLLPQPLLRLLWAHPPACIPPRSTLGTAGLSPPLLLPVIMPPPLLETFSPQWHWTTCPWGWNHEKKAQHSYSVAVEDNLLWTELLFFFMGQIFFSTAPLSMAPSFNKRIFWGKNQWTMSLVLIRTFGFSY